IGTEVNGGALPYNATATQVQGALESLSTIGTGNVVVTGGVGAGPGGATQYTITFAKSLAGTDLPPILASSNLNGGSIIPTVTTVANGSGLQYTADAPTVQAALAALSNVGTGNAQVT